MNSQEYWDGRYTAEGKIWGESPSLSAHKALEIFLANNVKSVLVPGSGYGRNTKLFSTAGMAVTGIEISETAFKMAGQFDPQSRFYMDTVLDMSFDHRRYDAIYCFNVLHLFRQPERELFLKQCLAKLKPRGLAFFTVFSNEESTFGQGNEIEPNTFESRLNRPVHYFTEDDLKTHFHEFKIIEIGSIRDPEDHGGQAHIHVLRYIFTSKF